MAKKVGRSLAKAGMVGSLVGVTATGLLKNKKAHMATGVALIAFSSLHYLMYQRFSIGRKLFRKPSLRSGAKTI